MPRNSLARKWASREGGEGEAPAEPLIREGGLLLIR